MPKYQPSPDARIVLLVQESPKQRGDRAHARFALYRDGMTVQEFFDTGGILGDIYFDVGHGYIAVSDYPYPEAVEKLLERVGEG